MIEKVRKYVCRHSLLKKGKTVLVALSGGADSVALLCILNDLRYPLLALHCNFHLRAEESDRDEAFVRSLCAKLNIGLRVHDFATKEYAEEKGISIEMAAREQRYAWFNEVMAETGAQCIATAHHQDDQAETLLLNLLRGTGIRGLAGMKPVNNHIVRPLLGVQRKEIVGYLNEIGQDFITDSTNSDTDFTRNRIRLQIMPLLHEINPSAAKTLSENCDTIRESIPFYQKGVEILLDEAGATPDRLPLGFLKKNEAQAPVILHEWLCNKGFNRSQKKEMTASLWSDSGKMWESKSHRLLKDRDCFLIEEKEAESCKIGVESVIVDEIGEKSPEYAYFDADALKHPVTLRRVRKGDSFFPFGMKGKKLVSDLLTDMKLSRFAKERQMVACAGNDIIWVVGLRSDNRYRVTSETKRILRLHIVPMNGQEHTNTIKPLEKYDNQMP